MGSWLEISAKDAGKFRRAAARLNHLSQDRPDIAVASCV